MKSKIVGGVFLWHGVYVDYHAILIDIEEVERRYFLIKQYETGELSLKNLNKIWR